MHHLQTKHVYSQIQALYERLQRHIQESLQGDEDDYIFSIGVAIVLYYSDGTTYECEFNVYQGSDTYVDYREGPFGGLVYCVDDIADGPYGLDCIPIHDEEPLGYPIRMEVIETDGY